MIVRNEVFSGLRIFFAICIVGYHFAPIETSKAFWAFSQGQTLVTFFFVLSGYVTSSSTSREWNGCKEYILKKLKAIIPLYGSTFAFCLAIELYNLRLPVTDFVLSLFMVQAWVPGHQWGFNAPAWFISALLACFFIYPVYRWIAGRDLVLGIFGALPNF